MCPPRTIWLLLCASAALCAAAASCGYLADRGRDFAEMFRAQGGLGRGLGVTARAAGLLDLGLNTPATFPHHSGMGLVYGDVYFLGGSVEDTEFMRGLHDDLIASDPATGEYAHAHTCWGVLPAVFARVDRIAGPAFPQSDDAVEWLEGPMLWSRAALDTDPWAHVHAFDAELGVHLLVVNAKVGFSPGEALDFLLGIVGVDLAGDDRAGADAPVREQERP